MEEILFYALRFLIILPAIIVHEVAHGYSAYLLGDPTAKNAGRLTLNPLKHIDPFGTVILPALLLFSTGGRVVFGYAKPVPFNPMYFSDRRTGQLITGIAGPAANLFLALVGALLLRLMLLVGLGVDAFSSIMLSIVDYFVYINLLLLFFNLLPLPGLDGSHVVQRFLSPQARATYASMSRYTMLIVFGVLWFAPGLIHGYLRFTVDPLYTLLTGFGAF